MARVAEQSLKYEDMFHFVKEMIESKTHDFSLEERHILVVAFRNFIIKDRDSLKLIGQIGAFEKFEAFEKPLQALQKKVRSQATSRCQQIVNLCSARCLPLCRNSESRVFIYKLMGDYSRYASEIQKDISQAKHY